MMLNQTSYKYVHFYICIISILHVCTCTLVGASVIEAESIRIRRSCGTALIGEVDSEFASQKA